MHCSLLLFALIVAFVLHYDIGELTLIVAAASVDVVITISIFGVFLGLAFSEGKLKVHVYVQYGSCER